MDSHLHHRVHVAEWLNTEVVASGSDILTCILSDGALRSVALLLKTLEDLVEICGTCIPKSWRDKILILDYCLSLRLIWIDSLNGAFDAHTAPVKINIDV